MSITMLKSDPVLRLWVTRDDASRVSSSRYIIWSARPHKDRETGVWHCPAGMALARVPAHEFERRCTARLEPGQVDSYAVEFHEPEDGEPGAGEAA